MKKDGKQISVWLSEETYGTLEKHCEKSGQSKTTAVERAIVNFCKKEESEKEHDRQGS